MVNDGRKLFTVNSGYVFINNEVRLVGEKRSDITKKIIFETCLILPLM